MTDPTPSTPSAPPTPEEIARLFHETYELMAPAFGYEPRPETRVFDPESVNGRLMIAACGVVESALTAAHAEEVRRLRVGWAALERIAERALDALRRAESAEAEVARLRAALREYGEHADACTAMLWEGPDCTCGLLLLAAPPPSKPSGPQPAPRYDEVYHEGTAWLDSLAAPSREED